MRSIEDTDPVLHVLIRLAAATGARRGELLGLQWSDLAGSVLTIRRSWVLPGDGPPVVKATKTGKVRSLSLDANTVVLLDAHRDRMTEAGAGKWMFPGVNGDPLRPDTVTDMVSDARDAVGEPTVTLRHLRHFAATYMLASGVPVHTVAARIGHDRTSTTMDVYGHALAPDDAVAADHLGGLLDKKPD